MIIMIAAMVFSSFSTATQYNCFIDTVECTHVDMLALEQWSTLVLECIIVRAGQLAKLVSEYVHGSMALSCLSQVARKCRGVLVNYAPKNQLFTSAAVLGDFKYSPGLQESEFWGKKIQRAAAYRDIDQDGLITRKDFKLFVQRYRDMGTSEEHMKKVSDTFMKSCDAWGLTDDDKSLTYDEFANIFASTLDKVGESYAQRFLLLFEVIDTSGDGVISFKEWEMHNRALGVSPLDARKSFDAMDVDGDGSVSKEEFIAYHHEFFYSTEDNLKSSILLGPLD